MIYLKYKSARGELFIGGNVQSQMALTAISGLGPPQCEYISESYLGCDGEFTVSEKAMPRTVTFSFDVLPSCVTDSREIYRILNTPGELILGNSAGAYRINTNRVSVTQCVRNGDIRIFSAQYVCDDPYFSDEQQNKVVCFELNDNIKFDGEKWNLGTRENPLVWTSSNSEKVIYNKGEKESEPAIVIHAVGDADDDAYIEMTISDLSGRKLCEILLLYQMTDGETVTVNCNGRDALGRYIVSSKSGDIISHKSGETSLSKFRFPEGRSIFKMINHSAGGTLKAYAVFENRYAGVDRWS